MEKGRESAHVLRFQSRLEFLPEMDGFRSDKECPLSLLDCAREARTECDGEESNVPVN